MSKWGYLDYVKRFPLRKKARIGAIRGAEEQEATLIDKTTNMKKYYMPDYIGGGGDPNTPKAPKGGWQGSVKYRFFTQPHTLITGAHIEPISQDSADVAAAKAISVVSPLPVDVPCGAPTEVDLSSTAQRAQGNLVIDTNLPAFPHWTTKVQFAPK